MSGNGKGPYHAFDRMILHALLAVVVTVAFAFLVWGVALQMGLHLPLPLVLVAVSVLAAWTIYDGWQASRAEPPAPVVPLVRRRPTTWEDAERMAALYRQGLITKDQLEAALRELVPPPPPDPPTGRHRR
ncbi:MAG: hypothetical protein M0Z49_04010 [Chloroflexi bacterium]|nr:hypothetical protein [Chloroflexota bacterium]